ncbi:hypothetical protein D3C84_1223840 [compost metagenome]
MQIRPSKESTTVYLDLTDQYISIGDGSQGEIVISIPHTITSTLDFSVGVYDIIVGYPSGEVVRILEGLVHISQNTTR